jgi:hypothetical protein
MGRALEVISGFNAVSTAAFQTVTNSAPNTAAVRNFPDPATAQLVQAWMAGGGDFANGVLRITSPRMHDNVVGIEMTPGSNKAKRMMTTYANELLYAQDTPTVAISDPGVGNVVVESMLYNYDNLPGTDARLYTWAEIKSRIRFLMSIPVTITSGGTAGQYSGAVAINSLVDQLKANQDYCVLGYQVEEAGTTFATVGITSADFGNLRIGGPASLDPIETRNFFIDLSQDLGVGCIPVFNAANKNTTIVDVIDVATATTANIIFYCALLTT